MLTLLTYRAGFGQFSLSAFCVKAAYLLQLSGQPWQRKDLSDPRGMPHSKLPGLKTDQRLIGDSDNIRIWLEGQGADFDPGLTDAQKGQGQAFIRMAEEGLYFHLVMDRWGNEAVWPTIRTTLFRDVPWMIRKPVANKMRRTLMQGLQTQGIARFSDRERLERLDRGLQAVRVQLKETAFLFSDVPTSADLSVAPMLASMRGSPVWTEVAKRVADDTVLSDYIDRLATTVPLP
ncbi:MAG: glutathione S-transferase [Paracoccaceae bacterium]|jgi:glutathione S-transferase